ncbi:hypothetical protein CHUAL_001734 [Chamberlinius hualienensis]
MEQSIERAAFSKYSTSSALSKLFFAWIWKDVWNGFRGTLKKENIHLPKNLIAENISEHLSKRWTNEVNKGRYSLLRIIYEEFSNKAKLASLLSFLKYPFSFLIQIFCLGMLMDSYDVTKSSNLLLQRYVPAIVIMAIALIQPIFISNSNFIAEVTGIQISIGCSSLVFQKVLRISTAEMSHQNIGKMISAIANDVAKFDLIGKNSLPRLFDSLTLLSVTVFLALTIGPSSMTVVASNICFLITAVFIGKSFKKIRRQRAIVTDKRLKMVTEMITEIRAVKMLSWENAYYNMINKLRQMELTYLRRNVFLRVLAMVQFSSSEKFTLFMYLVVTLLSGEEITSKKIFMLFVCNIILRTILLSFIGKGLEQMVYGYVSIRRIKELLLLPEIKAISPVKLKTGERKFSLIFESSWFFSTDQNVFKLNVSMFVPKTSITVITGAVGSGKSSLLLSLANELYVTSGSVYLGESICYLPQQPWLFSSTIRQNILFGVPYDELRYSKVIRSCALEQDLSVLELGDSTIVDDKGLMLSGGQKARICLARCLYRNCDIYLLDDPLSAVDVKVEKHIYQNCFLKREHTKTIVLVTHRLKNLSNDVHLISMENGRIILQGSFKDFRQSLNVTSAVPDIVDSIPEDVFVDNRLQVTETTTANQTIEISSGSSRSFELPEISDKNPYLIYFKTALNCCNGYGAILLIFGSWAMAQAAKCYFDIYMVIWIENDYQNNYENKPETLHLFYMGYIVLATVILFAVCYTLQLVLSLRASRQFCDLLLKRILKADMQFFNTHKSGEIINIFSKDLESLDETLPVSISDALRASFLIAQLFTNLSYTNPISIIPIALAVIAVVIFALAYSKSVKAVRCMETEVRSSKYTYMNSSIQGLAVIRSHDNQTKVTEEFNWTQDNHSSIWFLVRSFVNLVGVVTEFTSAFIAMAYIAIILSMPNLMNSTKVGFGISSVLFIGALLEICVNAVIETGNQFVSVKRAIAYLEVPVEDGKSDTYSVEPLESLQWFQSGGLIFDNVTLCYGSNVALKSINFRINPGEKIGIIGRTGAGKSSIVTALFRMAPFTGNVLIDGIDIKTLPLSDYRRRLSVMPQNPAILAGSVRYNLDPFQKHSDNKLWSVLDDVNLKSRMEAISLDGPIDHLSVGEKQLCCLARVLLNDHKVIILDEATANVDNKHDQEIQKIIRHRFKESTVLIIAHRLQTILDSDRVMVLHNGEILEFDQPSELLNNPTSAFKKMLAQTRHTI